jgi:AraC-like DNA-binding protein
MFFDFEERPSDSPMVDKVWRTRSADAGSFTSTAAVQSGIVVSRHQGGLFITFRGPETHASTADFPAEAEWFGIYLSLGAFYPHLPLVGLKDRNDVTLPNATNRSFYIYGSAWDFPTFDNADAFIARLVREGLLAMDPLIGETMAGRTPNLAPRTVQSRFVQATGITKATIHQIERANAAFQMLKDGRRIVDVVFEAGYFDQAHVTRSMRRFFGSTPGEIARDASVTRPPPRQ